MATRAVNSDRSGGGGCDLRPGPSRWPALAAAPAHASGPTVAPSPPSLDPASRRSQGAELTTADVRAEGGPGSPRVGRPSADARCEPGTLRGSPARRRAGAPSGGPGRRCRPAPGAATSRVDGRPTGWRPAAAGESPHRPAARHEVVFASTSAATSGASRAASAPASAPARVAPMASGSLEFESPHAARGGGQAVVYVPPGHDPAAPGTVLVGPAPLERHALDVRRVRGAAPRGPRRVDVVLLMPSGLGNSLYTADAEDEVLRAHRRARRASSPRSTPHARRLALGRVDGRRRGDDHRLSPPRPLRERHELLRRLEVRPLDLRAARSCPTSAAAHTGSTRSTSSTTRATSGVADPRRGRRDLADPPERDARRGDAGARVHACASTACPRMGHAGALVARFLAQVVDARRRARGCRARRASPTGASPVGRRRLRRAPRAALRPRMTPSSTSSAAPTASTSSRADRRARRPSSIPARSGTAARASATAAARRPGARCTRCS